MGTHYMSARTMCYVAGLSYRQLDYWTRTGMLTPAGNGGGSGVPRRFSTQDAYVARVLVVLHALGARHDPCKAASTYLAIRERPWTGHALVTPEGFVLGLDALESVAYGWVLDMDAITSYVEDRLPIRACA